MSGCDSIIETFLTTKNCDINIYVPNAFSPNGDGINDIFKISSLGIKAFNIKIYNRWGQIVFETEDLNMGWNGKKNNNDSNQGVYVYVINYINIKDEDLNIKGNISLIR